MFRTNTSTITSRSAIASLRRRYAVTAFRRHCSAEPLLRRCITDPRSFATPFHSDLSVPPPRCSVGIPPQNFGLDRAKWLENHETSAHKAFCRQCGNTRPGKTQAFVIQWHLFSPLFAISDRSFVIFKPFRAQFEGFFPRVRCFVIFKPLGGSCVPHDR